MVDSDDLYGPMEVDDDLSTALGTETLADRDIVTPPGFDNTPGSSADNLPIPSTADTSSRLGGICLPGVATPKV